MTDFAKLKLTVCAATVALCASTTVFAATYSVKAKIKSGEDKTILLVSKLGQVLDQGSVRTSTQMIWLKSSENPDGATLQIVNGDLSEGNGHSNDAADGEYFGTVELGWKGAKNSTANAVYTTLKNPKGLKTINLGTITIKQTNGAEDSQGYGSVSAKSRFANTGVAADAVKGVPTGTLASGLNTQSEAVKAKASARAAAISPDASLALPGADNDKDGIPNLFDVDDNNNGVIDNFDADVLAINPAVLLDEKLCLANNLSLFPNLKATEPDFRSTINYYGSGIHEATPANIASALSTQLRFAIQPIKTVCGSPIMKWEIRGIGVPYAPASFVEMKSGSTGDIQWSPGNGQNDGSGSTPVTTPFAFSGPEQISGVDQFEERVTDALGRQFVYAGSPNFVFVTHPMLVSYEVAGSSPVTIDYTLSSPQASAGNRIELPPGKKLTIRLHRPQRIGLTGEDAEFYDIGKMSYYIDIPNAPYDPSSPVSPSRGPGRCDGQVVVDALSDTPVNKTAPPTPLEMIVDIDTCFTDRGQRWDSGYLDLDIQVAAPNGGNSAQKIYLERTPPG